MIDFQLLRDLAKYAQVSATVTDNGDGIKVDSKLANWRLYGVISHDEDYKPAHGFLTIRSNWDKVMKITFCPKDEHICFCLEGEGTHFVRNITPKHYDDFVWVLFRALKECNASKERKDPRVEYSTKLTQQAAAKTTWLRQLLQQMSLLTPEADDSHINEFCGARSSKFVIKRIKGNAW